MKISLFNISFFRLDGGAMFGVVPKTLWSRVYSADDNNMIDMALHSLIVETDGHVILVDAGWGDKQNENFFRYLYLNGGEGLVEGIRNRGYSPEDVTDVVLTHLHADHCGGCIKNNIQTGGYCHVFPNARYHVGSVQWKWAVKNNLREANSFLKENIVPLSDESRLNLVTAEGELFRDFFVRFADGHTPGLMFPVIRYRGHTLIFPGDLIPTAAHLPLVWNTGYDLNPLKTIEEKKILLEEAVEKDYIVIFQHDKDVECATLQKTNKGIGIKNRFTFHDLINNIG